MSAVVQQGVEVINETLVSSTVELLPIACFNAQARKFVMESDKGSSATLVFLGGNFDHGTYSGTYSNFQSVELQNCRRTIIWEP